MKGNSYKKQTAAHDEIVVSGLPLRTLLGVFPSERKGLRTVRADLRIGFDIAKAARSDRLGDTLDWLELSNRLKSVARVSTYRLLEALAERISEEILVDKRVSFVDITLWKPKAIPGTDLGIHLIRTR